MAQKASEKTRSEGTNNSAILVVDDNSQHLKIYCWMLQRQGYHCIPALVGSTSVDLPTSKNVCLVLLDYRLNSSLTAADVADQLKIEFPSAPIIILSELPWMPEDAGRYAKGFVHKGEPARLMETVAKFCGEK